MAERMFGLETEYAITGLRPGGDVNRGELVERIMNSARRRLVHLPDARSSGLYLGNGSRLYVDTGLHPEIATPECTDPWELVRYLRAGEEILADLARDVQERAADGWEILWLLCNVDYSGSGVTWGCHESYLHRADPEALAEQLIPHLVTRIIYCGAGGFDSLKADLAFVLSPRAPHMDQVISGNSTCDRGIFHTKNEPLCGGGHHRLHLLCGESLCSQIATWLKVGTTALVVALTEAGFKPGGAVQLRAPLRALHTVAGDPHCRAELELANGQRWSALRIQRHYLEQVEAHLDHRVMPAWAGEVCRQWRRMLDLLEGAPESVATTLDWAIKRSLYIQHARRRGLSWDALEHWNGLIANLRKLLPSANAVELDVDALISPDSPLLERAAALTPWLQERGLGWGDLKCFAQLRAELLEIDSRFGQLGEQGIFRELDRQGKLTHHVPGVERIEEAMLNPPAKGRARLRGEAVRALATGGRRGKCDWQAVWDLTSKQALDLSDPFCEQEHWRAAPDAGGSEETDFVLALLERILGVHGSGRLRR